MIKDVMVRLDGTRADDARLATTDQIAERFDSHVVGLFLNVLPLLIPAEGDSASAAESVRLVDKGRIVGDKLEAKLRQRLAQLPKPVELRRFDAFGDTRHAKPAPPMYSSRCGRMARQRSPNI